MLGDGDLDAAEAWVDQWQAGVEERAAQAAAMSREVARLSGKARSDDGLVEATVDSSGALTGLNLDEEVRRHPADWLAGRILATVRAAQQDLAARVERAVTGTVGADSETGRAVISAYATRFAGDDGDR